MKFFRKIVCGFIVFIAIAKNTYADMIDIEEPTILGDLEIEELMIVLGIVLFVLLAIAYYIVGKFEKNKSDSKEEKNIDDLKEESDEKDK